jgi:glycosyltransferase involved in cell wall biosynthesis
MTSLSPAPKILPTSKAAKTIVFPLEGFTVSGGIRVITQIVNGLAQVGHRVRIIVPDYQSTPPFPLHEAVTLQVTPTHGRGKGRRLYYLRQLCRIAAQDCDVCFATGYKTPYYVWLSLRRCRAHPIPIYLMQHYEALSVLQTPQPALVKAALFQVARFGYRLPFRHIAVSRWIADQVGDPNCLVIPNGVDTETFCPGDVSGRPSERLVIGLIARTAPWKGYTVFLEALRHLPDALRAQITVLLAAPEPVALPEGIEVETLRPRGDTEMAAFYRRCALFVFSSFIEGFGLPPLEAMACGVPVLTTDCGGVREFANPANARLVPPGDAAAMAQTMAELLANPTLRRELSDAGLHTARQHALPGMIASYIRWIDSL